MKEDQSDIHIIDFHAEATSEKVALGYYLDGKVAAVLGTHTHVTTADEKILPHGTAFQCDVGMTGPYHSAIGCDVEGIIKRMKMGIMTPFQVAEGMGQFRATLLSFNQIMSVRIFKEFVLIQIILYSIFFLFAHILKARRNFYGNDESIVFFTTKQGCWSINEFIKRTPKGSNSSDWSSCFKSGYEGYCYFTWLHCTKWI